MSLETDLADAVLAAHPHEAARVLEGLPADQFHGLLREIDAEDAARVLAGMTSHGARAALAALGSDRAAAVVAEMPVGLSASLLRGLPAPQRSAVLDALPRRRARSVGALLRFPDGSAGARMDPDVLAVPETLTAREAAGRVRGAADDARYNIYVVDADHRLVGVVNQRELLLAPPRAVVSSFMTRRVHRLAASSDAVTLVSHPAWREVHSLPVVDRDGVYLGAIRYRAFRELEESLRGRRSDPSLTSRALGDLFRTGASAVVEMLAPPEGRGESGHGA
jgi:magnesium transporter